MATGKTVTLKTTDSNSFVGDYTFSCKVTDTVLTSDFYTLPLRVNFNKPVESSNPTIADKDIELYDSSSSYTIAPGVGRCTDPDGDTITYSLYYNETLVTDSNNELYQIVTMSSDGSTITITDKIRKLHGVFTY